MKRAFFISIILSVILISCEDIIYVDLNDVPPQLVIEGTISNLEGPYQVRLSKSTDYYNPSVYPPVNDAIVEIIDDDGNNEVLLGNSEGIYTTENIKGEVGRKYTLKVTSEGEEYTAESFMEKIVNIDSLKVEYLPETGFIESGYYMHCFFQDPPDTTNYYRVRAYINGIMDESLYLIDDRFTDGKIIDSYLFQTPFQMGDTAYIELISIDYPVYDYYITLSDILTFQGGGSPSNPANPNTNLSNGGLGYFGALAVDRDTLILQE
ncbi:MAG: DUF4249 domain-containing protein [Bacteroidales bacterium]|nr:DUF4249 domain-containing protein [Bacteroidales bacterium]